LSENPIPSLPSDISKLSALTDLNCSCLKLKTLPPEIGDLPQLMCLDLSYNELKNLPETMVRLTSLNSLFLSANDFEEMPSPLPENLQHLSIAGNKATFQGLPTHIGSMRVTTATKYPDQILDHLWLGSLESSLNRHYNKEKGITHIITCLNENRPHFPDHFTYHNIVLDDIGAAKISIHFNTAIEFIDNAKNSNGSVLVHCAAGISRSSTIVIAYVMKTRRLTFQESFQFVKSKRTIVSPNFGFRKQLMAFEKELNLPQPQ